MNNKTPWERAAELEGATPSERALTKLARKAFLSLWSYPNVYSDENRTNGKGDGKELVDLLVVFGDDVLLFSDKQCAYHSDVDVNVAWPRWYRRAVDKSAKQLAGAESFLKRFPHRVFLDKSCEARLPIALPDSTVARYHLIAVTRGGHFPARQFFGGGSSGSLMLRTDLQGRAAHEKEDYSTTYRERRMHVLTVYCHAVKEGMPTLKEAIGVASEPFSEGTASQDFMHVDLSEISAEELKAWRQQADELDILRPKTEMKLYRETDREFPAPFKFVDSPFGYMGPSGMPMNRAERRRAEREARKKSKKAKGDSYTGKKGS